MPRPGGQRGGRGAGAACRQSLGRSPALWSQRPPGCCLLGLLRPLLQVVDYNEMDQIVHQFKGSSASFGARQMAALCVQLRDACHQQNQVGGGAGGGWRVASGGGADMTPGWRHAAVLLAGSESVRGGER